MAYKVRYFKASFTDPEHNCIRLEGDAFLDKNRHRKEGYSALIKDSIRTWAKVHADTKRDLHKAIFEAMQGVEKRLRKAAEAYDKRHHDFSHIQRTITKDDRKLIKRFIAEVYH